MEAPAWCEQQGRDEVRSLQWAHGEVGRSSWPRHALAGTRCREIEGEEARYREVGFEAGQGLGPALVPPTPNWWERVQGVASNPCSDRLSPHGGRTNGTRPRSRVARASCRAAFKLGARLRFCVTQRVDLWKRACASGETGSIHMDSRRLGAQIQRRGERTMVWPLGQTNIFALLPASVTAPVL